MANVIIQVSGFGGISGPTIQMIGNAYLDDGNQFSWDASIDFTDTPSTIHATIRTAVEAASIPAGYSVTSGDAITMVGGIASI